MSLVSFQYSPFSIGPSEPFPNGQTVHRPMMIAHIVGPNGQAQTCVVCLDTGADSCIFPLSFAAMVGLDPLQMKMHMTGGCGSAANPTYYADVEIQLRYSINGVASTISFTTYAGFTPGMEAQGIGLLGQTGFFENFATTFHHKARTFTIDVK